MYVQDKPDSKINTCHENGKISHNFVHLFRSTRWNTDRIGTSERKLNISSLSFPHLPLVDRIIFPLQEVGDRLERIINNAVKNIRTKINEINAIALTLQRLAVKANSFLGIFRKVIKQENLKSNLREQRVNYHYFSKNIQNCSFQITFESGKMVFFGYSKIFNCFRFFESLFSIFLRITKKLRFASMCPYKLMMLNYTLSRMVHSTRNFPIWKTTVPFPKWWIRTKIPALTMSKELMKRIGIASKNLRVSTIHKFRVHLQVKFWDSKFEPEISLKLRDVQLLILMS